VTTTWNLPSVVFPLDEPNNFPKIDDVPLGNTCKNRNATIEGESGLFCGPVENESGLPNGYGVFITDNLDLNLDKDNEKNLEKDDEQESLKV